MGSKHRCSVSGCLHHVAACCQGLNVDRGGVTGDACKYQCPVDPVDFYGKRSIKTGKSRKKERETIPGLSPNLIYQGLTPQQP